jgi:hypothetical protein
MPLVGCGKTEAINGVGRRPPCSCSLQPGARVRSAAQLKIADLHFSAADWNGQPYVVITGRGTHASVPLWPAVPRDQWLHCQPAAAWNMCFYPSSAPHTNGLASTTCALWSAAAAHTFKYRQAGQPTHHRHTTATHLRAAWTSNTIQLAGPRVVKYHEHLCGDRPEEGPKALAKCSGRRNKQPQTLATSPMEFPCAHLRLRRKSCGGWLVEFCDN